MEEHSLLIDVEPTFDDSFDDWSVSDQPKLPTGVTLEQPTVVSDYLAVPKSFSLADKADLEPSEYGGRGQAIKNQSISEWSGSVKRSREESPLPSCGQKRGMSATLLYGIQVLILYSKTTDPRPR